MTGTQKPKNAAYPPTEMLKVDGKMIEAKQLRWFQLLMHHIRSLQ